MHNVWDSFSPIYMGTMSEPNIEQNLEDRIRTDLDIAETSDILAQSAIFYSTYDYDEWDDDEWDDGYD